jgi:aminoglycoside phosphotransferase (APT) family kinase protein
MTLRFKVEEHRSALEHYLTGRTGARAVAITQMKRLSGGAIQENWALQLRCDGGELPGEYALVLRTDSKSAVAVSLSRAQEFQVLAAVYRAGVTVPQPLWLCEDESVIGKTFYLMRRVAGTAAGHRLVKVDEAAKTKLAAQLGETLARLHTITPPQPDLAFLTLPEGSPARATIAEYRRFLDAAREPHPVLEYGLRWCEENAPAAEELTLIHRDFRTGNYMADDAGLTGVLDWEFAGWGNPLEDIGWFCSKAWRFGQFASYAGGLTAAEPFFAAYEQASGRRLDPQAVRYWEVMASLRWAVIAIQQGERHLSGTEPSLELALTGRIPAELEHEILLLTA